MIRFNELRLSNRKDYIIIDCEVNDDYKDLLYIDGIYLEYYKNASALGVVSDKAITLFENEDDDESIQRKRINEPEAAVVAADIGCGQLAGSMFYVIVNCEVKSDLTREQLAELASLECGSNELVSVGVVIDWEMVYERGMKFVSGLNYNCDPCADQTAYEGFIFNWFGLKLALSTCDTVMAGKMWDRFLRTNIASGSSVSGGCGCNR